MLAALLFAGFALRYVAGRAAGSLPALAADAPALFVWLSPKLFFVLEQAWIDLVQVALLCLAVAAVVAHRARLTAVLFGLVLASKQSMFFVVPLVFVLVRPTRRQAVLALAVGVASVLPFLVWDPAAVLHSTVSAVSALPPRRDALTVPNWLDRRFGTSLPVGGGFLAASVVAISAVVWLRRSVACFTAAVAMTYALFFAFNRFAFANYYFLLVGACALAAAGALHPAPLARSASDDPSQQPAAAFSPAPR